MMHLVITAASVEHCSQWRLITVALPKQCSSLCCLWFIVVFIRFFIEYLGLCKKT